jgi:hypothetical protein
MGRMKKLAGGLASIWLVSGVATIAQAAVAAAPGGPAIPTKLTSKVPAG